MHGSLGQFFQLHPDRDHRAVLATVIPRFPQKEIVIIVQFHIDKFTKIVTRFWNSNCFVANSDKYYGIIFLKLSVKKRR